MSKKLTHTILKSSICQPSGSLDFGDDLIFVCAEKCTVLRNHLKNLGSKLKTSSYCYSQEKTENEGLALGASGPEKHQCMVHWTVLPNWSILPFLIILQGFLRNCWLWTRRRCLFLVDNLIYFEKCAKNVGFVSGAAGLKKRQCTVHWTTFLIILRK